MTVHDSSPERRNLNILSISVILFYLADGKVEGSSLTMNMMNVSFGNTDMLRYSVVVFLLWFLFRYWVVNKDKFISDFTEELHQTKIVGLYRFFIDNSATHDNIIIYRSTDGYTFLNASNNKVFWSFGGVIIFALVFGRLFRTKPTLSAYIIPYILAYGAFYFILLN